VNNGDQVTGSEPQYTGPRSGDQVQLEIFARVIELQERDLMAGALVELATGEPEQPRVWVPLNALVVVRSDSADTS
jgi:hypothetical protein